MGKNKRFFKKKRFKMLAHLRHDELRWGSQLTFTWIDFAFVALFSLVECLDHDHLMQLHSNHTICTVWLWPNMTDAQHSRRRVYINLQKIWTKSTVCVLFFRCNSCESILSPAVHSSAKWCCIITITHTLFEHFIQRFCMYLPYCEWKCTTSFE